MEKMDENVFYENAKTVQGFIYDISRELSFIVEAIDRTESIEIESTLRPLYIKSMIEHVVDIVDNEAKEFLLNLGIKK